MICCYCFFYKQVNPTDSFYQPIIHFNPCFSLPIQYTYLSFIFILVLVCGFIIPSHNAFSIWLYPEGIIYLYNFLGLVEFDSIGAVCSVAIVFFYKYVNPKNSFYQPIIHFQSLF